MKKTIRTIVQLSLIAAFTLPLSVLAADKKTTRTFNVASSELIGKVRKLVAEDRAKGFAEYAKGARALAKEFPSDARPFIMMSEASGLVEDKKDATLLKEQAEAGILAILANDKKNETANSALMRLADSAEPAQAKAYLKQVIENTAGRLAEAAKGKLKNMEALGNPVAIAFEAVDGRKVDRDLRVRDRSRIEQRYVQADFIMLAVKRGLFTILPGVPDSVHGLHVFPHPGARGGPFDPVAAFDVGLDLRTEP